MSLTTPDKIVLIDITESSTQITTAPTKLELIRHLIAETSTISTGYYGSEEHKGALKRIELYIQQARDEIRKEEA